MSGAGKFILVHSHITADLIFFKSPVDSKKSALQTNKKTCKRGFRQTTLSLYDPSKKPGVYLGKN